MEYNLADLWECVADTVPDHEALVFGDRRLTFAEEDRPRDAPRQRAGRARRRPRRPRRVLPLQLDRVPRGDDRRVQAARGADQRQLPVRRGRAAIPARRRRRESRRVPPRVRTEARRDRVVASRPSTPTSRSKTHHRPRRAELGALDYETMLLAAPDTRAFGPRSADDLYILYTGGTTGMPKGVMWRHEDVFFGAMGGAGGGGKPITAPEEIAERCTESRTRCVPACPFMHGTAHWMGFSALFTGGTVVIPIEHHLDPLALWKLVERDQANFMVIVGDAFARPMLDALEQRRGPGHRREPAARAALGRRDPLADVEARTGRPVARRARGRRLRRVGDGRPGSVGRRVGRRHSIGAALPCVRRHAGARTTICGRHPSA